jgi:outer membrane lipoprotein-sorting protein
MNLISKAIAILGLTTLLSGLSPIVCAQPSQITPTKPEPSLNNTTTPPNSNSELSNQPDYKILAKTVANFFTSDTYQTESELQLSGSSAGVNFSSSMQVKTIVKSPNQFRSEITFAQPDGTVSKKYIVVSNGEQVWIYRSDLKQYAVKTYEAFEKSNDDFIIGMSSALYLKVAPSFKGINTVLGEKNLAEVLEQMLSSRNLALKGGIRNIDSKTYHFYEFTHPKDGLTFNALVEPETVKLEQLQILGKSQGMDIALKEKIIRRTENPTIDTDTFSFAPPEGTTKVDSLSIQPY